MTDQPDSGKKIGDGRENWTEKRIHNTNYFRSAALVGAVAIAGYTTSSSSTGRVALSEQASATLHLVSFGTGLGTMMYTTFVLGITMFQALPRRTFGLLQAQLFPRYFTLCSCTLLVQVSLTLWFDIRYIKKFQTHPTGVFFRVCCCSLPLSLSLDLYPPSTLCGGTKIETSLVYGLDHDLAESILFGTQSHGQHDGTLSSRRR